MSLLSGIFIVCAAVQIVYGLFFNLALNQYHKKRKSYAVLTEVPSVSVIICARNEEKNMGKLFAALDLQDFPIEKLEIIIVNDGSSDQTGRWADSWAAERAHIQVIHIEPSSKRDLPGKKFALRAGLQAASKEWILLTDADCIPAHTQWIRRMITGAISERSDVVLGYGAYKREKSFINHFIQFETVHTAIQYFSYAALGKAYMGVGRNLLYKRQVLRDAFQDPELVLSMQQTSSGDDDLTISYLAGKAKISILPAEEAGTLSEAPKTLSQYLKQKSRHASSSKYYAADVKWLLTVYAFTHFGFWLLAFSRLWLVFSPGLSGMIITISVLSAKLIVYYRWNRIFRSKMNAPYLLVFDFFWCIYNLILSPYIFWKNKNTWN